MATKEPTDTITAVEKRIHKRALVYIAESDLKNEQAKIDTAHKAACLFELLHRLTIEKLTGVGKAEETRTVTSIAGAYRRAMQDLGVLVEHVDGDDGELI